MQFPFLPITSETEDLSLLVYCLLVILFDSIPLCRLQKCNMEYMGGKGDLYSM